MSTTAPEAQSAEAVPTLPHPDEQPTSVAAADDAQQGHEREAESELDDIDIQVADREWVFEGQIPVMLPNNVIEMRVFKGTYVQRPLSYTAMLQFTGMIGERIHGIMSGPDGVSLDKLVGGIGPDINITDARSLLAREDFMGLDSFVTSMAKIAYFAPDFIEDCQCIWLRVPHGERNALKELWAQPPERGGLSMDDGEEMLDLFLAQNYQELEDFFVVRLRRLWEKVQLLRSRKDRSVASLRLSRP